MISGYVVLDYVPNQWATLSGIEARKSFRELMAVRAERVRLLGETSGVDLDGSDVSFSKLSEWMWSEIEPSASNHGIPTPYWRSVSRDIGLYWGEAFIQRWPQLRWDLVTTGPTFVDFREPVITGLRIKGDRRAVCFQAFTRACNLLSKDRREIVGVGDGMTLNIDLGPVRHQHFSEILRNSASRV